MLLARYREMRRGTERHGEAWSDTEREAEAWGQAGAEVVFGTSADVDCFLSSQRLGHKMVEAEIALGISC